MSDEPLPEPVQEERRKERAIGHAVIVIFKQARDNWKYLLIALMFLFNSPYAKAALESMTGWKLSGQLQAASPGPMAEGPVNETWKAGVDRQLKELGRQQKIIIKLLTDQ